MKKFSIKLLTLSSLTLLMTNCNTSNDKTLQITFTNDSPSIISQDLPLNHKMGITLTSNPTTGFQWTIAPPLPAELEILEDNYTPPQSDNMGTPGTQTFVLKATKVGTSTITFEYKRSWEKDKAPAQIKQVLINVKR